MTQVTKQLSRISLEAPAPKYFPGTFTDEQIFQRMTQWLDDGDKGITLTHMISLFKTHPKRATSLLNKFYLENREVYHLKRGWYIAPDVKKEYDEHGGLIEYTGYTATDAEVRKMENEGKAAKKRLFCIHPASLDNAYNINTFDVRRMDSKLVSHQKSDNEKMIKTDEISAPLQKITPSPTSPKKEDYASQSSKFTAVKDEVCQKKTERKPIKKKNDRIRPASPDTYNAAAPSDVSIVDSKMTVKELKAVQETTKDKEGFLVTSVKKKLVETDAKPLPPPPPKKKVKATPKHQKSINDFFKKI